MFFALLFLCIMVGMFSYFCGFLCQLSLSLSFLFLSPLYFSPSLIFSLHLVLFTYGFQGHTD